MLLSAAMRLDDEPEESTSGDLDLLIYDDELDLLVIEMFSCQRN
jgi:hypothetical protein